MRPTAPEVTTNSLPKDATPVTLEDASGTAKDTAPLAPLNVVTADVMFCPLGRINPVSISTVPENVAPTP